VYIWSGFETCYERAPELLTLDKDLEALGYGDVVLVFVDMERVDKSSARTFTVFPYIEAADDKGAIHAFIEGTESSIDKTQITSRALVRWITRLMQRHDEASTVARALARQIRTSLHTHPSGFDVVFAGSKPTKRNAMRKRLYGVLQKGKRTLVVKGIAGGKLRGTSGRDSTDTLVKAATSKGYTPNTRWAQWLKNVLGNALAPPSSK